MSLSPTGLFYSADFTPPAGDPERILAAAKLCAQLATDLHKDRDSADRAARTTQAEWHGRRKDRFASAAVGVQVQLDTTIKGFRSAHAALTTFATALRTAQTDIHGYAVGLARDQQAYASQSPGPHRAHESAQTVDGKVEVSLGMGEQQGASQHGQHHRRKGHRVCRITTQLTPAAAARGRS